MGGGAVHRDDAAAPRALDGVGGEARPPGDVPDVDLLVRPDAGRLHEVLVDADRALVVLVGVGDGGPVDLRPEEAAAHGWRVLKYLLAPRRARITGAPGARMRRAAPLPALPPPPAGPAAGWHRANATPGEPG